ncbi:MAG: hypothetical protein AB7R89_23230 [Dehalococcoidia bacterium]
MVTMTDRAAEILQQLQTEQGLADPPRLVSEQGSIALTTTPPEPEDHILYRGETPILRMTPEVESVLADATITTEETPSGVRLAIVSNMSPDGTG